MENWIYDKRADTWFYGTKTHGCGVFEEGDGWEGNVSAYKTVIGIGWHPTKEQAVAECLKLLKDMEQEYDPPADKS